MWTLTVKREGRETKTFKYADQNAAFRHEARVQEFADFGGYTATTTVEKS